MPLHWPKHLATGSGMKPALRRKSGQFSQPHRLDFVPAVHDGSPVFLRFGKAMVAVALALTLGGHWALLQTMAWTTMLAGNLQSSSLHEAVTRTFDGQHPCCMCRAIAAAQKSEKKDTMASSPQRLEFPPAKANPVLVAPCSFQLFPQSNCFAELLRQQPPTPPPREFPV